MEKSKLYYNETTDAVVSNKISCLDPVHVKWQKMAEMLIEKSKAEEQKDIYLSRFDESKTRLFSPELHKKSIPIEVEKEFIEAKKMLLEEEMAERVELAKHILNKLQELRALRNQKVTPDLFLDKQINEKVSNGLQENAESNYELLKKWNDFIKNINKTTTDNDLNLHTETFSNNSCITPVQNILTVIVFVITFKEKFVFSGLYLWSMLITYIKH